MKTSTLTFAELGLSEPILRALTEKKYTQPSPIQAEAIPHLLAGRDLMGSAQTGTGKTAAFALPILQLLSKTNLPRVPLSPRALILTPTRELAVQIDGSFAAYGKHLHMKRVLIYGGVGQYPQVHGMKAGPDIVIATPGRLMDLMQQGYVRFDRVEIFVLDEADRMLDMGFAPDVKRILAKIPAKRQSLLFSATLPQSILALAASILNKPVRVEMTPETPTAERVKQSVYQVNDRAQKYPLLREVLDEHPDGLVLVFSRTKHGAKKLAANLSRDGYPAGEIHGNKSQAQRQRALETFRTGRTRVLVATDVAARGIDVKGISLVVNFDLPNEPEAYVHRIGRTARAGAEGIAISFCDHSERSWLRNIQRLLKMNIPAHKRKAQQTSVEGGTEEKPRPTLPPHAPVHPIPHRLRAREMAPVRPAYTPDDAAPARTPERAPERAQERTERPAQTSDTRRAPERSERPAYSPDTRRVPQRDEHRPAASHREHRAPDREHRGPREDYPQRSHSGPPQRDFRPAYAPRPYSPGTHAYPGRQSYRPAPRQDYPPSRGPRQDYPPRRDDRQDSGRREDFAPRPSRPHPISNPRGYGNRPHTPQKRSSRW